MVFPFHFIHRLRLDFFVAPGVSVSTRHSINFPSNHRLSVLRPVSSPLIKLTRSNPQTFAMNLSELMFHESDYSISPPLVPQV